MPEWMHGAVNRINKLDEIDAVYNMATPDAMGPAALVGVAIDAFEAAMRLFEHGDPKMGRRTAEEALVYMMRGAMQLTAPERALMALAIQQRN